MSSNRQAKKRPDAFEHYLNRAKVAAERSTCLRRKVGAVIIRDGVEVSSGYVGSPRGVDHCIDRGKCLRRDLGIPSGERYELCRSVHAEQNAIINAARAGVSLLGGEMYISSEKLKWGYGERGTTEKPKVYGPCLICMKEIINAGLTKVHMREEGVGSESYVVAQIQTMLHQEEEEIRKRIARSDSS